jgi:hypothetical protein
MEQDLPRMTEGVVVALIFAIVIVIVIIIILLVRGYLSGTGTMTRLPSILRSGFVSQRRRASSVVRRSPMPVWMYWEGPLSASVMSCIDCVRKKCTDSGGKFRLQTVKAEDLKMYAFPEHPCFKVGSPALRSDFIRLHLLNKFGGLWLDASCAPVDALESWALPSVVADDEEQQDYFYAFMNPRNTHRIDMPCIETSAMSCSPGHPLVADWLDACLRFSTSCSPIERLDIAERVHQWDPKFGLDLEDEYHYVYWCLQSVLLSKPGGIHYYPNCTLYNTEDYSFFLMWNRFLSAENVLQWPLQQLLDALEKEGNAASWCGSSPGQPPCRRPIIFKFISSERQSLDDAIARMLGTGGSIPPIAEGSLLSTRAPARRALHAGETS